MLSPISYIRSVELPRAMAAAVFNRLTSSVSSVASAVFSAPASAARHPFKATAVVVAIALAIKALSAAYNLAKLRNILKNIDLNEAPQASQAPRESSPDTWDI